MKKKPRFSISKNDQKSTKKSLEELREEGQEHISGDDIQGGWLQFGGGIITGDSGSQSDEEGRHD